MDPDRAQKGHPDRGGTRSGRSRVVSRITIVGLVLLFALPLVAAWVLTTLAPGWQPLGSAHHGALLDPPKRLDTSGLQALDDAALGARFFAGKWTLVVIADVPCADACRAALYKTRQARRGQGKDMNRVQRLWVVPAPASSPAPELLRRHPDLRLAGAQPAWLERLPGVATARASSGEASAGGAFAGETYIVDPRGYAMMRYSREISAKGLLEDLERVLRASRIG